MGELTPQDLSALIEEHLPLVKHIVFQVAVHFPRHVEREELARAGALGLVAFAVTGALLVDRIGVGVALLCAVLAWLVVSIGAYAVAARDRLHHAHRG